MFEKIALVASVVLPLWNIPLIYRIIQRRSSQDVSLSWALGVWVCLMLMLPAGIVSPDRVWKVFTIVNSAFFSGVVITVLIFHRNKK